MVQADGQIHSLCQPGNCYRFVDNECIKKTHVHIYPIRYTLGRNLNFIKLASFGKLGWACQCILFNSINLH